MSNTPREWTFYIGELTQETLRWPVIKKTCWEIWNLFAFFPTSKAAQWMDPHQAPAVFSKNWSKFVYMKIKSSQNYVVIKTDEWNWVDLSLILEKISQSIDKLWITQSWVVFVYNWNINFVDYTDLEGFDLKIDLMKN